MELGLLNLFSMLQHNFCSPFPALYRTALTVSSTPHHHQWNHPVCNNNDHHTWDSGHLQPSGPVWMVQWTFSNPATLVTSQIITQPPLEPVRVSWLVPPFKTSQSVLISIVDSFHQSVRVSWLVQWTTSTLLRPVSSTVDSFNAKDQSELPP